MIRIAGCGDAFISRRLPEGGYEGFEEVSSLLHEHDFRFCNLETTVHDNEGYPSLFPGGGWAMAHPRVLGSVRQFGFNALSVANNHTMDYCHKGLEATLRHLEERGIAYAGAGMNLAEASSPAYVECPEGRVALIAVTSSFHDSDAAGNQGLTMPGRPGVNPLRHKAVYQLEPDLYEKVLEIGAATGMNDTLNWSEANGYRQASGNAKLRNLEFCEGAENRKIAHPLEKDMLRTAEAIKEAAIQADCIVVSVHSHQFKGSDETPDDFIVEFCRNCIDEGANIVFGHGSHILRGVEVYSKGVIFYGLADFILQNETVEKLPADFYEKYSVEPRHLGTVGQAMRVRSNNGTRGLSANPKAWQSIMASIEFDGQLRSVTLYPIELQLGKSAAQQGWPVISSNDSGIIESAAALSEAYGTTITIEDGIGRVHLA